MKAVALKDLADGLWPTKGELDVEKGVIERELRIFRGDARKYQDLASRIRAYNEKAARYNRSLADARAIRVVLGSSQGTDDDGMRYGDHTVVSRN